MHPPEASQPSEVKSLPDEGLLAILLTARGPDYRDSTRHELNANGYDFDLTRPGATSKDALVEGFPGLYRPGADARARQVSFAEGTYMVAGQHKGKMLRLLLARADASKRFDAIVFVDDDEGNVQAVESAFEKVGIELVTFHYTAEASNVEAFQTRRNKNRASRAWRRLDGVLKRTFDRAE
jgi:hypothetical protein